MILNETSYFGAGARAELAGEVKRRGYKKALVVTDAVLVKAGTVPR
jgi:Alcohol dehydrogenase, class IV